MTEDFMEQNCSDANGSEIEEYEEKSYEELKGGKHAIKLPDEAFTCPYCPNKKRHGYQYIDLLQHATMIGKSDSKKRSKKDKANHLALAKYLGKDISEASGPTQPIDDVDHLEDHDGDEMFVWPWKGIVVNLPIELIDGRYIGKSGSSVRDELTKRGFNPTRVHPLWNFHGHSGSAVVEFSKDMVGFYNAMSFEKAYEADHHGKKDWDSDNESKSGIYGWVARAEDYRSNTIIGEHLRKIADIRTVSDIKEEEDHKTIKLLSNLENVRESKKRRMEEITMKCMETENTLSKLIAEKDKNDQAFNEEIKKIHLRAQEHIQKIFNDHDKTKMKIENERRVLELQTTELQKREAVNENERKKLAQEIEENAARTSSLRVASDEQRKADESVMKLADDHKGFKELSKATHIGVKRMGELENKPFYDAMKQMYNETEAEDKASELCSLWEEYLRDPSWHPFKVITIDGKSEKIIDETDEKLKSLKKDLGEKVYEAVTTALTEINDYNPSGGYVTTELWNFTEGKKATLKDGVSWLLKMWNTRKRKRIT